MFFVCCFIGGGGVGHRIDCTDQNFLNQTGYIYTSYSSERKRTEMC